MLMIASFDMKVKCFHKVNGAKAETADASITLLHWTKLNRDPLAFFLFLTLTYLID